MRRRRQKNPLLMRIIVISALAHIIILPVLAHFGAFKKIQQKLGMIEAQIIKLPPPEQVKVEVKKQKAVVHKVAPTVKKSASSASHSRQAAHKSNMNLPKVVASAGNTNTGDEGGASVDNTGTGKAGQLPTTTGTKPPVVKETMPPVIKKEETPVKVEPPVKVARNDTPVKTETQPVVKPEPMLQREPVFTEAVPVRQTQPTIPDDLRQEALDKTVVVELTVMPDGTAGNLKVAQSTGNDELDRIGLDTARQWKFKPATRDGVPVESRVRLHIEFQVS